MLLSFPAELAGPSHKQLPHEREEKDSSWYDSDDVSCNPTMKTKGVQCKRKVTTYLVSGHPPLTLDLPVAPFWSKSFDC